MPRNLSVQAGEHANWVGAHYWSALEHKSDWDAETTSLLYNEHANGDLHPRTFVIDSIDSIRPLPAESSAENLSTTHGFELKRVEIESEDLIHGHYWTDIWELGTLPPNRLVIPVEATPSESSNRFWFESRKISAVDSFDESGLRNLIEETDSSIDTLRVLATLDDGLSGYSLSSSEYLQMAYPKASLLLLTSPLPHSTEFRMEHSIPTVLNWMSHIFYLTDSDSCLMVSPDNRDLSRLASTGEEAFWLDTISPSRVVARDGLSVEMPFLSINGRSVFSPDHAAKEGSLAYHARNDSIYINNANPIRKSLYADSSIVAGTLAEPSLIPRMEGAINVMHRFIKEFKPVWEQFDVEQADLYEMNEVIRVRIGDMCDQLQECD